MAFFGRARVNAYGPHSGLLPMVLQRKRSQGRTGHMIMINMAVSKKVYLSPINFVSLGKPCFSKSLSLTYGIIHLGVATFFRPASNRSDQEVF